MINIEIRKETEIVQVYNCGILILEETDYNDIVLTINEALTIIDDLYQIDVLKEVLKRIEDIKRLVA